MIADVEDTLGVVFPLDDIVLPKPFVNAASKARSSMYLGLAKVMGRVCHHVAFQHEAVEWQAWVEDGPEPLMRKSVTTYKHDDGAPRYIAHFTEWDPARSCRTYFVYQGTDYKHKPAMQNGITMYTTVHI